MPHILARDVRVGLAALLLPIVVSCSGNDTLAVQPALAASRGESLATQPIALELLAKGLALALSDSATRVRFKERLRKSQYIEHKVMLNDMVLGLHASDGALLARGSSEMGHSLDYLRELASLLPPIEVYMPIKAHRGRWNGQDTVLVVAALDEKTAPVGFTPHGERVVLSLGAPPLVPTIVLTRRETRSTDTVAALLPEAKGVGDESVLPVSNECQPLTAPASADAAPAYYTPPVCDGTPIPPPLPQVWPNDYVTGLPNHPGVYLQAAIIYDNHEPWIRGDPELEFSVDMPHSSPLERSRVNFEQLVQVSGLKIVPTQCSGAKHPVLLTILERDDGHECPTPAKEKIEAGAKTAVKVKIGFDGSIKGWEAYSEAKDILAYFGIINNNDIIFTWTFPSWEALRSLNMTRLHSNEADIWLTTSPSLRGCVVPPQPFDVYVVPC